RESLIEEPMAHGRAHQANPQQTDANALLVGVRVHPASSIISHDEMKGAAAPAAPASCYAPGARYWTCSALRRASIVSSTVRRTVVSNELRAPPPLIAIATAAMDTLSGASHRL